MSAPTSQQVTDLATPVVVAAGAELDTVTVTAAGRRSVLTLVVDSEAGLSLDEVAELSRQVAEALDAAPELGESPFTLQVTTPGTDRPLTTPRHWRRARGRRASITLGDGEVLLARIGELHDDQLTVAVPARGGPEVRTLGLGEVGRAVVEVEFSPPESSELDITGPPSRGAGPDETAPAPRTSSEEAP